MDEEERNGIHQCYLREASRHYCPNVISTATHKAVMTWKIDSLESNLNNYTSIHTLAIHTHAYILSTQAHTNTQTTFIIHKQKNNKIINNNNNNTNSNNIDF